MLGKTANGLFWMYRYLERAENTERLIEAGQRIALTRLHGSDDEWRAILQTAGGLKAFEAASEGVTKEAAVNWLLRARENGSSVLCCIETARQNARLVRTAITGEVWESMNSTYMMAQETLARKVGERDLPGVLVALRRQTALVRGMTHGTMLRNDIYNFARVGTFLERADNTARILDVKYYVLLPSASAVGGAVDNVHWESILRSVSARGGFRMEYGPGAGPRQIIDFLILNTRMPRSLSFCVNKLGENLKYLAPPEHPTEAQSMVSRIQQEHLRRDIDDVLDYGLHEFIETYLDLLARVARQIEVDYRFYE